MSLPFAPGSTLLPRRRRTVPARDVSLSSPKLAQPSRDSTLPSLICDLSSPSSNEDLYLLTPPLSSRPSDDNLFSPALPETRPEVDYSVKVQPVQSGAKRYSAADAPHPFAVGTYPKADYSVPFPSTSLGFKERTLESGRDLWAAPQLTVEPDTIFPVSDNGDAAELEEPWSISQSGRRPRLARRKKCKRGSIEVLAICLLDPLLERVHERKEDVRLWGFRARQSITVAQRKAVRRVKGIGSGKSDGNGGERRRPMIEEKQ